MVQKACSSLLYSSVNVSPFLHIANDPDGYLNMYTATTSIYFHLTAKQWTFISLEEKKKETRALRDLQQPCP